MANRNSAHIRHRIITEFEYINSLEPSKLAVYMRTKLAHNQGCPPVPLAQVFTMCQKSVSCDECWWGWFCSEHDRPAKAKPLAEREFRPKCWECRWGVRGDNRSPIVYCTHKKFYGVAMDPENYCCFWDERYFEEPKKSDVETAIRLGELKESNKQDVADEIKKRYELKQLARELERRRKEKEWMESGDQSEGAGGGPKKVRKSKQPPELPSPPSSDGG